MAGTPQKRVAGAVPTLIAHVHRLYTRIHDCEACVATPAGAQQRLELRFVSVRHRGIEIRKASLEIGWPAVDVLDQVSEALGEIARGEAYGRSRDRSDHAEFSGMNFLWSEIGAADGVQRWTQLVERGCIEGATER